MGYRGPALGGVYSWPHRRERSPGREEGSGGLVVVGREVPVFLPVVRKLGPVGTAAGREEEWGGGAEGRPWEVLVTLTPEGDEFKKIRGKWWPQRRGQRGASCSGVGHGSPHRRQRGGWPVQEQPLAWMRSFPFQEESRHSRDRSRSVSRSRSPRRPSDSRLRQNSRSYSPAPRRHGDYSVSPKGKQSRSTRSPKDNPHGSGDGGASDSYYGDANHNETENGYKERGEYNAEESRLRHVSPGRASRSPSGSRSRSADSSPRRTR